LTFIGRHGKLTIPERIMKVYIVGKVPRGNGEHCHLAELIYEYLNANVLVMKILMCFQGMVSPKRSMKDRIL